MTTPLQNAMMLSSIIGSIMANYDPTKAKERLRPITELKARLKKFMWTRSRSNKNEFFEAIQFADRAWQKSINHFADKKLSIEAISTIVRLYDLYEEPLTKYANIRSKQIEAFARGVTDATSLQHEMNSYEVADYIIEQLSVFTGIKRVNKFKVGRVKQHDNK
ncbi:MAG: hypothetical protein NTW78_04045 [Campylobacterales bacterium]|nr:hypothetical protein [Campylobacterales bacterium]